MKEKIFSGYQVFLITMLALLNFMVFLDFVILTPLGPVLLKELAIDTRQYGWAVSAYAFCAAISGFLAAGFADRFDRKKILVVFLLGFIVGTAVCAAAPNYQIFVIGRIIAGIFGGVLGGISFAIISDVFKMEVRGRVMGFVQMAPGLAQVLGVPLALLAANFFSWHVSFWLIVIIASVYTVIAFFYLQPISEHLKLPSDKKPIRHLFRTLSNPNYILAYASSMFLMLAVWMILPFNTVFVTSNVGISMRQLPLLYLISGVFTFISAPIIGKWADGYGKYRVLFILSILSLILIPVYTQLSITSFLVFTVLNILFFSMLGGRMISLNALITGIPQPQDRGAFMSINASIQQLAGGLAAGFTGLIVTQAPKGKILNYDVLGYCLMATVILVLVFGSLVNRLIFKRNPDSTKIKL
jgi:predicted MFS family arabinose efflux permease